MQEVSLSIWKFPYQSPMYSPSPSILIILPEQTTTVAGSSAPGRAEPKAAGEMKVSPEVALQGRGRDKFACTLV